MGSLVGLFLMQFQVGPTRVHNASAPDQCTHLHQTLMSDPSILRIHSFRDIILYISALLTDARYFVVLATLVILGDAALTQLIIRFVPCQHQNAYSWGNRQLNRVSQTRKSIGRLI